MKLSELKQILTQAGTLDFALPDGSLVPSHFHITEAGYTTKNFVDCGGNIRQERKFNMQLWLADDYNHRLDPGKLLKIIGAYENIFGTTDLEVEVEYQTGTLGRYDLDFADEKFLLRPVQAACLASDHCGVTPVKKKMKLAEITAGADACCAPGSNCC